ncbi:YdgH/BhsA/McbA family protein [Dryocola clanedunensis]|uniref:DUF1471 domain-containing protein n=1 Tax=Cedecea sulfonylureivorans TaxID=3051154 RepID=UPI0019278952|nr:DUF1471 domain-containing protein [Cedecea sulfonylureivorans]
MKRSFALTSLLLSVGMITTAAQSAEDVAADCVTGLNEIGLISLNSIAGSAQDVEKVIALKADEQGASYYRIIKMQENYHADSWRAQAILYA